MEACRLRASVRDARTIDVHFLCVYYLLSPVPSPCLSLLSGVSLLSRCLSRILFRILVFLFVFSDESFFSTFGWYAESLVPPRVHVSTQKAFRVASSTTCRLSGLPNELPSLLFILREMLPSPPSSPTPNPAGQTCLLVLPSRLTD